MATRNPSFAATQYGASLGEYRGSFIAPILLSILGALLLVVGIIVFLAPPSANDGNGPVVAGVVLSVFGLIILGVMVWRIIRARGAQAQLFEQGFAISLGGKTTTARWDDISSVTQNIVRTRVNGIPAGTTYRFTISLANGETVRLDNTFGKIARLGADVQRISARALLPRAVAAYQSGAWLPFGAINISQAGISNGKETAPWSNITSVALSNGLVAVKRSDKRLNWLVTPISKTPNIYVLMALVDRIKQGGI